MPKIRHHLVFHPLVYLLLQSWVEKLRCLSPVFQGARRYFLLSLMISYKLLLMSTGIMCLFIKQSSVNWGVSDPWSCIGVVRYWTAIKFIAVFQRLLILYHLWLSFFIYPITVSLQILLRERHSFRSFNRSLWSYNFTFESQLPLCLCGDHWIYLELYHLNRSYDKIAYLVSLAQR